MLTKTQVAQATAITTIKGREIITVKGARRTRRRITAQTSIHALSVGRSIPENVGTTSCYLCGKEGHYAKNCYSQNQNRPTRHQQRAQGPRLNAVQAAIEGPQISQGRLEAPEPQAYIYAYTKGDAEAGTSNVVTGQLLLAKQDAHVLIDSGATHSFASYAFSKKLCRGEERIRKTFRTALPFGDVLLSEYWVCQVLIIICDREFHVDLIIIDLKDFDVILGMDFLGKYNAVINCRQRKVTFTLDGDKKFTYIGKSLR